MSERETTEVATLDIRGVQVEVSLRVWTAYGKNAVPNSTFRAKYAGKEFTAETLESLRLKLLSASKQKAIRIKEPVDRYVSKSYAEGDRIERWYVTGTHLGTGKALLESEPREDDGKVFKEQSDHSYHVEFFNPLTSLQRSDYVSMKRQYNALHDRIDKFEKTYGIQNIEHFAKAKVNEKLDSGEVVE